ncbi:hypothetical protein [Maribacter sp. 2307ULW6-5]|uniref:hypothetical protein n=1 Tax=Maribacter sp. 2307ULW6-5 TaxID=3386275 RepID=UPI0039BC9772
MQKWYLFLFLLPCLLVGQETLVKGPLQNSAIYFGAEKLQLHPNLLSGIRVKNTGWALLSFGMAPQSRWPFLSYGRSNHIVAEPQFHFSFQQPRHNEFGLLEPERSFRGATSPNEFILLKLKTNTKKDRRYIFAEINGYNPRIKAETVPFGYEEKEAGEFSVFPLAALAPGEYGFVHKDVMTSPAFADFMIFDFSVE